MYVITCQNFIKLLKYLFSNEYRNNLGTEKVNYTFLFFFC